MTTRSTMASASMHQISSSSSTKSKISRQKHVSAEEDSPQLTRGSSDKILSSNVTTTSAKSSSKTNDASSSNFSSNISSSLKMRSNAPSYSKFITTTNADNVVVVKPLISILSSSTSSKTNSSITVTPNKNDQSQVQYLNNKNSSATLPLTNQQTKKQFKVNINSKSNQQISSDSSFVSIDFNPNSGPNMINKNKQRLSLITPDNNNSLKTPQPQNDSSGSRKSSFNSVR
jgi:hypothetical protein